MEFHQHTHTPRKKWTHYFWEFFMLFLAVTLGFFMENQREHYVERKRTKVLAKSLYEDIKKDTAALHAAIKFSREKNDSMNAAIRMLHLPAAKWQDTLLYTNLNIASRVYPFEWTQGTYDQIKASGSLRYFNQELVTLLNTYAVHAGKVLAREDIDIKIIIEQYFPMVQKFFNAEVASQIRFNQPISGELWYFKTDLATVREIINQISTLKTLRSRSMQEYEQLLVIANEVLDRLKKKYHLE